MPSEWSETAFAGVVALVVLSTAGYAAWRAVRCTAGWRYWMLHSLARGYTRLLFRRAATGVRAYPEHGPGMVVANHTSPVDPMLLWADHAMDFPARHLRVISFMVAREYAESAGVVGWVCRMMRSIPVDRQSTDVVPAREALRRLRNGDLVGMFPEGGINLDPPNLGKASTGVAWLALKARVPVYPVFIRNSPRGTNMVNSFYTRSRSMICYAEPLEFNQYYGEEKSRDILRQVAKLIMQRIAETGGVSPACSDD